MNKLVEYYEEMLRIRLTEEALMSLKTSGEVPGSIHLCCGQEAIPVGVCSQLHDKDYVTATYRGHGWAIARGAAPVDLLGEAMGRDSRLNGGRGGSPYLSDAEHYFLGQNSIVGAGVPIACGAALSAKVRGDGQVSVVSIGDGATNQGAVHEGLNMAAALDLPLITVIENNVYSEMTPWRDMAKVDTLADRGAAYGIPAVVVDGNDVEAVAHIASEAVARARNNGGPTLIEAHTERLVGHYSGDLQHYRPVGEVNAAKTREPLTRLKTLLDEDPDSGEQLLELTMAVEAEIQVAVADARAMSYPDTATFGEHVYA